MKKLFATLLMAVLFTPQLLADEGMWLLPLLEKMNGKKMAEMGFNHVRFAAIGLTKLDENGKLIIDTPFVDAMIKEADKNNISVSVRLQGYAVNLRDFKNVIITPHNSFVSENNNERMVFFFLLFLRLFLQSYLEFQS